MPVYQTTILRNCDVLHRWRDAPPGEYQSLIWGSAVLDSVHFREDVGPADPSKRWWINDGGCGQRLELRYVVVDGPNIGWGNERMFGRILTRSCLQDEANSARAAVESTPRGLEISSAWSNSDVSVRYEVLAGGRTTLRVYDVAGRRIRDLVDRVLPIGEYMLSWDRHDAEGRRVTPGIYFVRLITPAGVVSRRVVLAN